MRGIRKRLPDYLASLRFPWLLLLTVTVFVLNALIPDPLPFIDEILLALAAAVLARLKQKKPPVPRPRD